MQHYVGGEDVSGVIIVTVARSTMLLLPIRHCAKCFLWVISYNSEMNLVIRCFYNLYAKIRKMRFTEVG